MEEILRFQQLRQAQKLSEEQKIIIGLPLYFDNSLSVLANKLKDHNDPNYNYDSIINGFKEEDNSKKVITDVNKIHPIIRSLYNWLNFKAKPIKIEDFKKFVQPLKANDQFDLKKEWTSYADNLILAIHNKTISINYCIDFQLLIRACYIFKLCITANNKGFQVIASVGENLLNEILNQSILLPTGLFRSRCCEDCSKKGIIEIPKNKPLQEIYNNQSADCNCPCDDNCKNPNSHCICIRTYIADLFIIKEELARYEEGDIADIENILAGENKLRHHRTLLRTEDTSENEKQRDTSEERDHQVNEKFSLQSEVKRTVDSKVNVDAGVTATLKYGEAVTLTPHANVTANFSKSDSQNIARSYSKEIVDRSVTKIQEKVRTLQISKVINELEEKNRHSIDNTQVGAEHRAGIYYWVNKVTHAQVFNYGKHMMFDAIIPEPAAIFKKLYELKLTSDIAKGGPEKPTVTLKGIDRDNYGTFLSQYLISTTEDIEPPNEFLSVQVAFSQNVSEPEAYSTMGFSSNEFKTPDIPKGYTASSIDYDVRCSTGHPNSTNGNDDVAVSVHVGNICLLNEWISEDRQGSKPNQNWVGSKKNIPMNDEVGNITIGLAGLTSLALSLSGTISIKCKLTAEAFEKWKAKIYNIIVGDYNRKLDAYNASNNKNAQLIQIKGRNPFLNREIERNELKRNVIAILMCNYFNGMGSMVDKVSPCGYPEIDFEKLEKDAPIIQFFEQVFEWNYLNYLFYHSMWARKCKWPELIDEDSGDPLFDKFLMAGASRVQIPIRPRMEHYFCWFLKTGQIWGATGEPPIPEDDEYVSMIQELKESKQCDYIDRPGLIEATNGSDVLKLKNSNYYWAATTIPPQINLPNLENDIDREILINYKIYRIVKIEQNNPADPTAWDITIDRLYETPSAKNLKHGVGAKYVGAPWEIVIPTKLVYLRNKADKKLPTYPLT